MVSLVFILHRSAAGWARKYEWFDLAHGINSIKLLVERLKAFYSVSSSSNSCSISAKI